LAPPSNFPASHPFTTILAIVVKGHRARGSCLCGGQLSVCLDGLWSKRRNRNLAVVISRLKPLTLVRTLEYYIVAGPADRILVRMAEFAAVLGLTASIVQLIDASSKVWQRIKNFRNGTVFRNINAQLPVLQQTLERIQTAQKHGSFDSDTQQALSGAINECLELVTDLDAVVACITPADTSSKFQRGCKGIRSFGKNRRIQDIQAKLDRSVSRLSYYFSVDSSLLSRDVARLLARNNPAVSSPEEKVFFEVPALQVSCFVGREELLDRISASFLGHSGFARGPVTVLLGMGGQGVPPPSPIIMDVTVDTMMAFPEDATCSRILRQNSKELSRNLLDRLILRKQCTTVIREHCVEA